MLETHPFGFFIPPHPKYFLLGSFIAVRRDPEYTWYYCSKRNQFWSIIEEVYGQKLPDKQSKIALFTKLGFAVGDLITECERKANNSQDNNLINCKFATTEVANIISKHSIRNIFFSSRFVEATFQKYFRNYVADYPLLNLTTLPSPSPRNATVSFASKVKIYSQSLPSLIHAVD